MASTIKLKNGSGAPLAADLVTAEPALDLTNKRLYTEDSLGNVIEVGTNPTSLTTGDITTTGAVDVTGDLDVDNINIDGNAITSTDTNGNIAITPNGTGEVDISKVDIDSGAIDGVTIGGASAGAGTFTTLQADTSLNVDGTVTADELKVNGGSNFDNDSFDPASGWGDGQDISPAAINFKDDTNTVGNLLGQTYKTDTVTWGTDRVSGFFGMEKTTTDGRGDFVWWLSPTSFARNPAQKMRIANNGDISFYEDTGVTPKMVWKAADERLGIGTTSPAVKLDVNGSAYVRAGSILGLYNADNTNQYQIYNGGASGANIGELVFLQGGVAERMRIDSSGNLDLTSGGGDIIMANGAGIDFSASEGGGADNSLLDDYEEGTWNPVYTTDGTGFSSMTMNPTFNGATYTKIGNTVFLRGYIRTDALTIGSASGNVIITGLPFTSTSGIDHTTDGRSRGACTGDNFASNPPTQVSINTGIAYMTPLYATGGATDSHSTMAPSDLETSSVKNILTFTLSYIVD